MIYNDAKAENAAIQAHIFTDEWKQRADPATLKAPPESEEFLRNRLWKTLQEGIEIGRRLQVERTTALFRSFICGEK